MCSRAIATLVAWSAALADCAVVAQEPPGWRSESAAYLTYDVPGSLVGETWSLGILPSSNILECRKIDPAPFNPAQEDVDFVISEIDLPGVIIVSDSTSRKFLVVGLDSTSGTSHLSHIQVSGSLPRSVARLSSAPVSVGAAEVTSDIVSAYYNSSEQRLYLFDRRNSRIVAASWSTAAALPTSFEVVPTSFLKRHEGWKLVGTRSQVGVLAINTPTDAWEVAHAGGAWTESRWMPNSTPAYTLSEPSNALGPLWISGPVGSFELVQSATNLVVATGSLTSPNHLTAFTPPTGALIPSMLHYIRSANTPSDQSERFAPLNRWGKPIPQGGLDYGAGIISYARSHVDSPRFSVVTSIRYQTATPFSVSTHLWVAAAAPGEPDPVVHLGGDTYALTPQATAGPVAILFDQDHAADLIGVPYPIPAIPLLENVRLYFQFVGSGASGAVVASDVFQTVIRPAPAQQGRSVTAGSGLTAPMLNGADARSAITRLVGHGLTVAERATHATMVDALRRQRPR